VKGIKSFICCLKHHLKRCKAHATTSMHKWSVRKSDERLMKMYGDLPTNVFSLSVIVGLTGLTNHRLVQQQARFGARAVG
jgi:hypothetical protein